MKSGWNPTRRNRNIGTGKQGRGRDNRLVIPDSCPDDRRFYENLDDAVSLPRSIAGREITFLVQPVTRGFVHACTVDDVCRMLDLVPANDLVGIELLVLRQPTRKQTLLRPCWGRLCYDADTGRHWGRAILLEAQPPGQTLRWDRSMTPDDAAEFERLKADGHAIEGNRRAFAVIPNPDSIRATQLYRTLLHELGHHVDYLEKVSERARDEADYARLQAEYVARPRREREDFAHRYAGELSARLRESGLIPFDRLVDTAAMKKDGLDPAWFGGA